MPFLELVGEACEGIDTYSVSVLSVMLFPREDEAAARREWRAASMAKSYREWKRSGASTEFLAPYHRWLDDLCELPQSPERVIEDGLGRSKRARYSGFILEYLIRLAQHHPKHCRVERVKALLRELSGSEAPGESLLNQVWAGFKSVSHLWHARNNWQRRYLGEATTKNVEDNANWKRLLSEAESWRRAAERFRLPPGPRTQWWCTPEGFPLEPVTLEIRSLSPQCLQFLNNQFPQG